MKLQDAYVSERNLVGDWDDIGYKAPGTAASSGFGGTSTNFKYTTAITDTIAVASLSANQGWKAVNVPAMNDCAPDKCSWTLALDKDDTGNGVKYTANTDAKDLTPSFDLIGK